MISGQLGLPSSSSLEQFSTVLTTASSHSSNPPTPPSHDPRQQVAQAISHRRSKLRGDSNPSPTSPSIPLSSSSINVDEDRGPVPVHSIASSQDPTTSSDQLSPEDSAALLRLPCAIIPASRKTSTSTIGSLTPQSRSNSVPDPSLATSITNSARGGFWNPAFSAFNWKFGESATAMSTGLNPQEMLPASFSNTSVTPCPRELLFPRAPSHVSDGGISPYALSSLGTSVVPSRIPSYDQTNNPNSAFHPALAVMTGRRISAENRRPAPHQPPTEDEFTRQLSFQFERLDSLRMLRDEDAEGHRPSIPQISVQNAARTMSGPVLMALAASAPEPVALQQQPTILPSQAQVQAQAQRSSFSQPPAPQPEVKVISPLIQIRPPPPPPSAAPRPIIPVVVTSAPIPPQPRHPSMPSISTLVTDQPVVRVGQPPVLPSNELPTEPAAAAAIVYVPVAVCPPPTPANAAPIHVLPPPPPATAQLLNGQVGVVRVVSEVQPPHLTSARGPNSAVAIMPQRRSPPNSASGVVVVPHPRLGVSLPTPPGGLLPGGPSSSQMTNEARCNHRKSWKRLRSKRGFAYFACYFCGAKWRITTSGNKTAPTSAPNPSGIAIPAFRAPLSVPPQHQSSQFAIDPTATGILPGMMNGMDDNDDADAEEMDFEFDENDLLDFVNDNDEEEVEGCDGQHEEL